MSFDAMRWAATVKLPTVPKVVLMILAARSNKAEQCWPSLATLCEDTGLSDRAVRNGITALVESGHISKVVRGRFGVVYTLLAAANTAPGAEYEQDETPPNTAPGAALPAPGATNPIQEPVQEPRKEARATQAVAARPDPRGSRLPDDWTPDETDRAYAVSRGLDPDRVADRFRNFWLAKAGAGARKADWPATWRNWCLRDAEPQPAPVRQVPASDGRQPFRNGALELLRQGREREEAERRRGPVIDHLDEYPLLEGAHR